jgi:anti-sigma regulatory factor (Ser/Thr protein kinase)
MSAGPADVLAALGWPALGQALARVPAPLAVTSGPRHELVYANDAYLDAFGHGGRDAVAAYPELDGQSFLSVLDGVYSSGLPYQVRTSDTSDRPGTGPVPYTFLYAPLRGGSGHEVTGVLMIAVVAPGPGDPAQDSLPGPGEVHRSLLPPFLPDPDDLEVAVRYLDGSAGAGTGGAWYDVIGLGAGRTGIAVGDVAGRGPQAVAVMGQVRAALRAYARLDLPPAEIIEQLDAVVADLGVTAAVTCCYAVFDPVEATVTAASAGHHAPLTVYPDGFGERLKVVPGDPLGARGGPVAELTTVLGEGGVLVLYTAGVSAQLGHPDAGVALVSAAMPGEPDGLDGHCGRIAGALSPSIAPDGGAVLLVQRRVQDAGPPRSRTIELALSGGHEPTRRARAFCHGALATWHVPDQRCEDIVLVVSELVTNAVVHGESARQLRLRKTPSRVIVEVFDNGRRMPHPRVADLDAESGRGLHLVAKIADRWGARPVHGGKVVWCEFDLADPFGAR